MDANTIELPDMAATFNQTLSELSANKTETPTEAPKEIAKEAPKEVAKETNTSKESQPESKTDASPETKTARKKSALDAALEEPVQSEAPSESEQPQVWTDKDLNLSKAREALKKQSEELKSLRELSKKASEPDPKISEKLKSFESEAAKLREENAKLRDSIVALDVKYDPEFQTKFVQGRDKLVNQAAAKVEAAGGDRQAFMDAMEMTGNKRNLALKEILQGVEDWERGAIIDRLGKIDSLEEEMSEVLSNSQQSFEEIRRKRTIEQQHSEQEVAAFKDSKFEEISKRIQKESGFFRSAPSDSEGADEYNSGLTEDLKAARSLIDGTADDVVVASLKAARFDRITSHLIGERDSARQEADQLREELAKYHGSEPGFRGGSKEGKKEAYDIPMDQLFHAALSGKQI